MFRFYYSTKTMTYVLYSSACCGLAEENSGAWDLQNLNPFSLSSSPPGPKVITSSPVFLSSDVLHRSASGVLESASKLSQTELIFQRSVWLSPEDMPQSPSSISMEQSHPSWSCPELAYIQHTFSLMLLFCWCSIATPRRGKPQSPQQQLFCSGALFRAAFF